MPTLQAAAQEFLAQKRIAIAGVSREDNPGNLIYATLKKAGYQVFAVNPKAETIAGDPCYPSVSAIPGGVDGVVITTHPAVSAAVIADAAQAGVKRAWLHRSFGEGSYSAEAIQVGQQQGMVVISGGCPMMFCEPADFGHRCMRWILSATGSLPKTV